MTTNTIFPDDQSDNTARLKHHSLNTTILSYSATLQINLPQIVFNFVILHNIQSNVTSTLPMISQISRCSLSLNTRKLKMISHIHTTISVTPHLSPLPLMTNQYLYHLFTRLLSQDT